jgi:hypothetical protein
MLDLRRRQFLTLLGGAAFRSRAEPNRDVVIRVKRYSLRAGMIDGFCSRARRTRSMGKSRRRLSRDRRVPHVDRAARVVDSH